MSEQAEVPWFSTPPNAVLLWSADGTEGYLHFWDPQGNKAVVPVTYEPAHYGRTTNSDGTEGEPRPIWQIEIDGDIATVRDSVHYAGHWHSPNPVKFRIVAELEERETKWQ